MEKRILKIDEVGFNKEYYPRVKWSWKTSYQYSQAMNAGAKFPPIEVAKIKGKYYVIDGKHRLEALKNNEETHVQTKVNTKVNSFKKLFVVAVERNVGHGRQYSTQDKANIALQLKDMKFKKSDISKMINVPLTKLDTFISQRVTNTFTGEQIPLKTSVKHLSDGDGIKEKDINIKEVQEDLSGLPQLSLLDNLIKLLENDLLDIENKEVRKRANRLFELLAIQEW